MPKATTIADYADRIARVADYIAEHLDDPIDLERLAGIACFSPFHFHRIYHGLMGEAVGATVRRLRLHRASVELLAPNRPIAAIGRRAGYGSVAAFTRAFRAAYGVPPGAYRGERPGSHGLRGGHGSVLPQEDLMYEVTIRDTPTLRVAALSHHGDYQEIGNAFEKLTAWAAGHNLLGPGTRFLGIYYDDPEVVPTASLRADACITIPAAFTPADPLRLVDIASGSHAVLLHVGPYADLPRAYHWLFSTWLPRSGEEGADRPCFEEYLNNPRELPPSEWRTEISLPLVRS